MKYDSVLDQQSISGKIVSLILCVWKPCYVKSGHISTMALLMYILMQSQFDAKITVLYIYLSPDINCVYSLGLLLWFSCIFLLIIVLFCDC